jgi:hypothetical protein
VTWAASLKHGGSFVRVDAQALVGAGGIEYLFRPLSAAAASRALARGMQLPPGIVAELRLLARSGRAVIAVASKDAELARGVLPYLPSLVRQAFVRAVHLCASDGALAPVYTIHPQPHQDLFEVLEAYHFEAITVDLPISDYPMGQILRAAPLSFAYLAEEDWQSRLADLGIRWILSADRDARGAIGWELRAAAS